ncbi:ABC transporter ATP-binding protein [bacterium]|nr:ABC transporter ATP-binding protein [bacterium]
MKHEPVIEVRNLTKRYGTTTAVDNLSFTVHRGEVFGLLGPNGAGKTTAISILSCLIAPTSGTAQVCGFDVVRKSLDARSRIGVVPQEIALYPSLSAKQNLLFWGRMYGVAGNELESRVDELLEVVGLTERGSDRIDTFSGGMKRRINIAAGLIHRPEVLFLDEPTVGIDPQTRRSILELVKGLNEDGLSILYTTHYLEGAEYLCHRVGIMDEGRLIAIGTQDELIGSIGATDVITVSGESFPASVVALLESLDGVRGTTSMRGYLTIEVAAGSQALSHIVQKLAGEGTAITAIEISSPNLESVFLHLTGKTLMDSESDEDR